MIFILSTCYGAVYFMRKSEFNAGRQRDWAGQHGVFCRVSARDWYACIYLVGVVASVNPATVGRTSVHTAVTTSS